MAFFYVVPTFYRLHNVPWLFWMGIIHFERTCVKVPALVFMITIGLKARYRTFWSVTCYIRNILLTDGAVN